jgi:ornithine carbamoyltransferase
MLGMNVRIASPAGYELPSSAGRAATAVSRHGAVLELVSDPRAAVAGRRGPHRYVASMGQEDQAGARERIPRRSRSTKVSWLGRAGRALHALPPAHRGLEVTDGVMDSPNSVVSIRQRTGCTRRKALPMALLVGRYGVVRQRR